MLSLLSSCRPLAPIFAADEDARLWDERDTADANDAATADEAPAATDAEDRDAAAMEEDEAAAAELEDLADSTESRGAVSKHCEFDSAIIRK